MTFICARCKKPYLDFTGLLRHWRMFYGGVWPVGEPPRGQDVLEDREA